jgi:hypothetical protein
MGALINNLTKTNERLIFWVKRFHKKYKNSSLGNECGGPHIYVLGLMFLFFLLAVFTAFAYAHKIQTMATMLHEGIKTAAVTSFGDNAIPDPNNYGVEVSSASNMQQEFMTDLQNDLSNWPQSSYTLQSFQTYGEEDKGESPPSGFYQPIPGASAYITMTLNITIIPGFLPMSNTKWAIPIYVIVTPNSFESSTGVWNLVRST